MKNMVGSGDAPLMIWLIERPSHTCTARGQGEEAAAASGAQSIRGGYSQARMGGDQQYEKGVQIGGQVSGSDGGRGSGSGARTSERLLRTIDETWKTIRKKRVNLYSRNWPTETCLKLGKIHISSSSAIVQKDCAHARASALSAEESRIARAPTGQEG